MGKFMVAMPLPTSITSAPSFCNWWPSWVARHGSQATSCMSNMAENSPTMSRTRSKSISSPSHRSKCPALAHASYAALFGPPRSTAPSGKNDLQNTVQRSTHLPLPGTSSTLSRNTRDTAQMSDLLARSTPTQHFLPRN
ncbi:hypothetical protein D3C72_1043830 [compost metagenome]